MKTFVSGSRICTPVASRKPARVVAARRSAVVVRAQSEEERMEAMKRQYEEAMKDPATAARLKQMEEQMKNPAVQQQMMAMQQVMQNQALMQRMAELKEDPEFKPYFDSIRSQGMGGLFNLMNNQEFMEKLEARLADVMPAVAAQAGAAVPPPQAAPPAAQAPPEITDLLSAARYGDVEAVEDYIAIGKDVNQGDSESRTPLHMAAAINNVQIANLLITAGAKIDCVDSKQNTPLHYAAGYGRPDVCRLLLESGASGAAKNGTGKTPFELVKLSPNNPINVDEDLLYQLEFASKATA